MSFSFSLFFLSFYTLFAFLSLFLFNFLSSHDLIVLSSPFSLLFRSSELKSQKIIIVCGKKTKKKKLLRNHVWISLCMYVCTYMNESVFMYTSGDVCLPLSLLS